MSTSKTPDTGKALRVALAKSGGSRKLLAEAVGLSPNQISRLATGAQSIHGETLGKIAAYFGMKVSEFLALGED